MYALLRRTFLDGSVPRRSLYANRCQIASTGHSVEKSGPPVEPGGHSTEKKKFSPVTRFFTEEVLQ
jgi:hypothetical protein